jgi:hypothetical protein
LVSELRAATGPEAKGPTKRRRKKTESKKAAAKTKETSEAAETKTE